MLAVGKTNTQTNTLITVLRSGGIIMQHVDSAFAAGATELATPT